MTMVFVCLTLCSMMSGLLLSKIRRETGLLSRLMHSVALVAIGFCTAMATTVAIAISRVSLGELFTVRMVVILLAMMLVGILVPSIYERLRARAATEPVGV